LLTYEEKVERLEEMVEWLERKLNAIEALHRTGGRPRRDGRSDWDRVMPDHLTASSRYH
jgi:hypothetical protein